MPTIILVKQSCREEKVMNTLHIYCTENGIHSYPLHVHSQYEIIYYLEGCGKLKTDKCEYPFAPGNVIIIPSGTYHGSVSENGFKNISICGDWTHYIKLTHVVVINNVGTEGKFFAELLYKSRFEKNEYLNSLGNTFVLFLLRYINNTKTAIELCINKIVSESAQNAYNPNYSIADSLAKSGYAEDYIRQQFKKQIGMTPTEFLNHERINYACYLIEVYGKIYSLTEISQRCGYSDYSYFLRNFRKFSGMSPLKYKKSVLENTAQSRLNKQ